MFLECRKCYTLYMNGICDCLCVKCRSRSVFIIAMSECFGTVEFDFKFQAVHSYDGAEFRMGQLVEKDWLIAAIKERAGFLVYCTACVEENGVLVLFEDGQELEIHDANQGRLIVAKYLGDEFPPDTPFWRIEELFAIS